MARKNKQLREELERRVVERTRELEAANERLKAEVAELKSAEGALRQGNQQYEALVHAIDGIVWEADAQTFQFTFISRQAERILGYPAEQWLNEPDFWRRHTHPEDREVCASFRRDNTGRGQDHTLEYRMIAANGRVVWLRDSVTLLRTGDAAARLLGIMIDITECKRADEVMRGSEEGFRKAFDANPAPSAIVRLRDRCYVSVNRAFVRTFGYTAAEVIDKTGAELGIWPDAREQKELWQRFLDKKPIRSHETQLRTKSGDLVDVLLYAEGLDLSGEPCLFASVIDIAERNRAQDAMRRSEDLFRAIVEDQSEMIVRWKPDGTRTFVNRAYCRVFGGEPEDFVGTSFFPLIGEKYRDGIWKKIRSLTPENPLATEVHESVGVNSEIRWQEWTDRGIFDEHGRLVELQSTGHDITERKRAEDALRASEEQLRALSARIRAAREEEGTRIAREIHDELGSALSGLKWDLEEIDELLSESTEASGLREKVAALITLTDRAVDAVRRISSELRPTALDEFGLVEALRWHAKQLQARTGIVIDCDLAESVDLGREQSTAIFRIVQEALTNVLRHARASVVEVEMGWEEDHFVLTIRDNGKGITEDQKSGPQSLGMLGMRERAHLLGGEIEVEGAEGRGTVITVRVPAAG